MRVKDRYQALKDVTLSDYCIERGDVLHVVAIGKEKVFVRCKCYDAEKLVEDMEEMINKCELEDKTWFQKLKKGQRRPKIGKYFEESEYLGDEVSNWCLGVEKCGIGY